MKIIDNFAEISLQNDLNKINNGKWFDFEKLDDFQFKKMVKISFLDEDELKILNKFIEKILKFYPIFYENIKETQTPNHERNKKINNKKLDQLILQNLDSNSVDNYKAVNLFLAKEFEKITLEEATKKIFDKELAEIYKIVNNLLAKEFTIFDVYNDIYNLVQNNCFDLLLKNVDSIKNLTKLITTEIFLRTKEKEEYIFTDELDKINKSYLELNDLERNQLIKLVDESKKNLISPEIILEKMKRSV